MVGYELTLHRSECAGANMKCQLLTLNTLLVECTKHVVCEMKTGSWGCHTTLDFAIHSLIGGLVALLCLTVEIGRYGQFARNVEDVGKGNGGIVPRKAHEGRVVRQFLHAEADGVPFHDDVARECSRFPFLGISHQTLPRTLAVGLEHLLVVGRLSGFEQEHLNQGSCVFAEMNPCLNDARVVEHHQRSFWQMVGQIVEHVLAHVSMLVEQQFAMVALWEWELGDAFVGQWVVVVADMYFLGSHIDG